MKNRSHFSDNIKSSFSTGTALIQNAWMMYPIVIKDESPFKEGNLDLPEERNMRGSLFLQVILLDNQFENMKLNHKRGYRTDRIMEGSIITSTSWDDSSYV